MRGLALFVIGLFFGGGIGFLIAAGNGITLDGHDHSDPAAHGAATHDDSHDSADLAGFAPGGICTSTDPKGLSAAAAHQHDRPLILPKGADAPSLRIALHKDPVGGWNLELLTENFRFAPDKSGQSPRSSEGHGHLYINGTKITRLYGPWYHIAELPDGAEVEVTLNSNDHRPLSVGPDLLSARTVVPAN